MAHSYLMESDEEAARLEDKTDAARVRERLLSVGLRPGSTALDAGAGTGAVARVMASLVGDEGKVVALDASEERLAHGRGLAERDGVRNLSFQAGDLYAPPFGADSFDFVWCEFVFEYLADPDRALAALVPLVRPGGRLVIADLDGNGLFHDPLPPELVEGMDRFVRALEGSFDPHAGRRLYHRFRRAGLSPVEVQVGPYHLYPGTADAREMQNWERKFKTLRARVAPALGGPAAYDAFVERYLGMLRDPDALSYSVLFLVSWTRPR